VTSKKVIEANGFVAEFFQNAEPVAAVHHYVVMRKGSVEILGWGQERSPQEAERAALDFIETLSRGASATG
jgi:hypothetical protein